MQYSWSWGAFAVGFVILIISILLLSKATKVSELFGGAITTYQKYAYIAGGVSLAIMFNLHSLLISFLANNIFGGVK